MKPTSLNLKANSRLWCLDFSKSWTETITIPQFPFNDMPRRGCVLVLGKATHRSPICYSLGISSETGLVKKPRPRLGGLIGNFFLAKGKLEGSAVAADQKFWLNYPARTWFVVLGSRVTQPQSGNDDACRCLSNERQLYEVWTPRHWLLSGKGDLETMDQISDVRSYGNDSVGPAPTSAQSL